MSTRSTWALLLAFTLFANSAASFNTVAKNFVGIVDYAPVQFEEVADEPFYYSIGDTLRYGRTIDDKGPVLFAGTLFGGELTQVYESPDHKKAAIVYGGNLYLVETAAPARLLLKNVDNKAESETRVGGVFYKHYSLQWDSESKAIYIIRDKKQERSSDQRFSRHGTLVRIDVGGSGKSVDVVDDFRSYRYFFLGGDAICFDYAPGDGSVIWKCSYKGKIRRISSYQTGQVTLDDGTVLEGRPFVSYEQGNIYESEIWLSSYGFSLKTGYDRLVGFYSRHNPQKPIFRIRGGRTFKGNFVDGIGQTGCKVLPGGRYVLLDVLHDNFTGQLLVDGETGKYRELPIGTRIWRNLNSWNYRYFNFQIDDGLWPEFVPAANLRVNQSVSAQDPDSD